MAEQENKQLALELKEVKIETRNATPLKLIEIPDIVKEAGEHKVVDTKTAERAGALLGLIKKAIKAIEGNWRPLIEDAHKTWKDLIANEKNDLTAYLEVEKSLKLQIAIFHNNEIARIANENERGRLELEKAQKADMDDIQAKISAAMKEGDNIENQIEALRKVLAEPISMEKAQLVHAKINVLKTKLAQTVDIAEVQAGIAESVHVAEYVKIEMKKNETVTIADRKVIEVKNPMAILKAIVRGDVPFDIVSFNVVEIKKFLAQGGAIPGISVTIVKDVRAGR